jgi:type I restriction enzyme, S subunit
MSRLKDVSHYVQDKIDVSMLKADDYITTDNMLPNRGGITIAEDLPKTERVTKYAPGDTLVSNIRPYFKKIWYADKVGGCSNDVIVFRAKPEICDSKFLYYVLLQDCFFDYMMSGANGTKMPRGNKKTIPDFVIPAFDIETQYRIASILSAYDDLIENNQKQIKLLEEAARRLYKEWFVDLRFPGYETVKIIDGVPEGWSVRTMEDIADYLNGYAFKPSDWGEKGKPIIKIKEMNEGVSTSTPRNTGNNVPSKYNITSGDILFSWSATLTAMIWDDEDGLLNQHLFKVTPKDGIGKEFVLQSILKTLDEFKNLTTGSTMKHIQRGKLKDVSVKLPDQNIMDLFTTIAEAYRKQILTLKRNNSLLNEARDRLLPKLMSGEIEV